MGCPIRGDGALSVLEEDGVVVTRGLGGQSGRGGEEEASVHAPY
jgi:hypothetical protein